MGKIFIEYLEQEPHYNCSNCSTTLAAKSEVISRVLLIDLKISY